MKKLLASALLFSSLANASEVLVANVSKRELRSATPITATFQANLNGQPGVSVTTSKRIFTGKNSTLIKSSKFYEVSELSVAGDELVLATESGSVVCGTLGTSRILKVPVLNLSGDCEIQVSKSSDRVIVSIITE